MFKYISISKDCNPFVSPDLTTKIKALLYKYRNVLVDDYYSYDFEKLLSDVSPHLYAGLYNDEFIGFVYLNDWRGGLGKLHSACMTVCIDKKYWGRIAREASRHFIARIFANYKCYKLKALVFEHNRNARNFLLSLGFKKESTLLNETFKNGKPVNMSVYSVYKDTFIS